jgi:hypothetical protein
MSRNVLIVILSFLVVAVAVFIGKGTGNYIWEKQKLRKKREYTEHILAKMQDLHIGDTLPNHKFEVIGSDSAWLYDLLTGKCVLTIVLPECEDCLYEAQELKAAITDSNDARHFIFATWENPRTFVDIKTENNLASPFVYDHKRAYFSQFDITTFPFNITLDSNGVVLDMLSGAMWKDDFQEIIEFNKHAVTHSLLWDLKIRTLPLISHIHDGWPTFQAYPERSRMSGFPSIFFVPVSFNSQILH